MTADDLFRAFSQVLKLSVGAPLVLSACTRLDTRSLEKPACNPNGGLSIVGLKPTRAVNYTELRTGFGRGQEFALADGGVNVISTSGTKCETATNQATCKTGLDVLNSRSGFYELCGQICIGYQLATTEGDLVTLIDTPQAFRDFLGPIDAPQEAAWRVLTEGYDFQCFEGGPGKTGVRAVDGGFEAVALQGSTCGRGTSLRQYLLRVGSDGTVTRVDEELLQVGDPNCVVGRRPEGLIDARRTHARTPLARHFEATASLEAAAVQAFIVMERELLAHGAPSSLSLRARIAAEDERRHTHTMASLARRFGGRPVHPVMERRPLRSLDAMALENVVEGCVRETFGALLAQRQGLLASDDEVRSTHQTIAAEETTHASLSWDLHGWMNQTLGARSRRELVSASRRAVETLKHEFCTTPQRELADTAGLPSGDEAVAMIDGLDDALFRAALS
ncbi:MAG: ferritin-like domain-containing protein [Myxococcales bacterium]|nr:ferritin-like domain-containing protein [Myxococcales bacterium]